jgi:glycosyltransferase involved in cell wall biosynthesis
LDQEPTLKILQLVPEALPTFRADVSVLFGKYLPRHGVQTDIVGKASSASHAAQGFASSRRPPATASRWRKECSFLALCTRALLGARKDNCDVIQVRDMVSIGLLAMLLARLKGIPMTYGMSYLMSEGRIERARAQLRLRPSLRARLVLLKGIVEMQLLYRVLLPRAAHVFVQSDAMLQLLLDHKINAARLTAVPMAVDMEVVDGKALGRAHVGWEGLPVIAYLGTLDQARCLDHLLDAFLLVRASVPEARLLLIGDSPTPSDVPQLLAYAARLGLADAVHVTGWMPSSQAWEYLLGAEAAVSYVPRGKLYDVSSPTKILEYLALGMPCVGNDIPDQAQVLTASQAGWLVESSATAMATALVELLQDTEAARARAQAGPSYIHASRSYRALGEALAQRYLALFSRQSKG